MNEVTLQTAWRPLVDICCDAIGSNATTLLFFSAAHDARLQAKALRGADIVANPPYGELDSYILFILDKVFAKDTKSKDWLCHTRCLFVLPLRNTGVWLSTLEEHPHTTLVALYTQSARCFYKTTEDNCFREDKLSAKNNIEPILVWELNARPATSRRFKMANLMNLGANQVAEVERIEKEAVAQWIASKRLTDKSTQTDECTGSGINAEYSVQPLG